MWYTYDKLSRVTKTVIENTATSATTEETYMYDAQGNPTTYLGHTLNWEKGRQLKTFDSYSYTYNANGIRTGKFINGDIHEYTLDGTKILRETWADNSIIPLYDYEDSVCGIIYNSVPYYFVKNLQGDIISITDKNGAVKARYTYDAWGVCIITSDTSGVSIATINPFRYRGYYYDTEIGMYYLQSRYYDPTVGRFVNSDDSKYICIDNSVLSSNLLTYCNNNPINSIDYFGNFSISRTWLALGLDIVLTLVVPYFSGPLDVFGRILSGYAKRKNFTLIWDKLLYGVVPKFKGLFSKFFTRIREAIWRITGSIIANCTTTLIGCSITNFVNFFRNQKWSKVMDFISCFFSAGSMVAGFLDFVSDGELDGRIRI